MEDLYKLDVKGEIGKMILNSKLHDGVWTVPENTKPQQLYSTVIKYLKENDIRTYEDVYESNKIENTATALVDELLSIVKDDLDLKDDE